MLRRPPRSKLTATLFPYTTRFRSTGGHGKPPTLPYLRSVHSSNWSSQPKRRRACRLSKTVSEISILTNGSTWFRRSFRLPCGNLATRSEEHTSELQSLMRISYAVFCLKKKKQPKQIQPNNCR